MKTKNCSRLFGVYFLFTLVLIISSCSLPKDTVINGQTIPACSSDAAAKFDFVKDKMEGLLVNNPTNEDIGYPKAFYDGWKNYYWVPVNGKKMALCGRYYRFSIYDGQSGIISGNDSHEDEYDWNLTIVPHADFGYIINNVFAITGTSEDWQTAVFDDRTYTAIQAEITPDESLYNNEWFPNIGHENSTTNVISPTIGVYGPWIMDNNHNNRPEIHPCEIIWWRKKLDKKDEYYIFGIQDDSNRYDEAKDFVFDNNFGVGWKPWAVPPITSQFKIPFEYSRQYSDHLVVNIEELKVRNVVTPSVKNSGDSDDGSNHILRFNQVRPQLDPVIKPSNILVEVNENISNTANLGIRFVDICKKSNGNIIGYIQIFTAYGKNISGQEGYHVLKVTLDYPKNKIDGGVILQ